MAGATGLGSAGPVEAWNGTRQDGRRGSRIRLKEGYIIPRSHELIPLNSMPDMNRTASPVEPASATKDLTPPQHIEDGIDTATVDGDDGVNKIEGSVLAHETAFVGLGKWAAVKTFWMATLLANMACFAAMNDGYQNSLPGSIVANQGFINRFGRVVAADGTRSIKASDNSLWGGMMPTGQIVGSAFAGWFNDKLGRKWGMYVFTFFFILGTVLEMVARNSAQWAGAKFVFGFAQGMCAATAPIYISEIAPSQIRGSLISLYGLWFAIGQLLSSIVLKVIQDKNPLKYLDAIYTEWAFHGAWIFFALLWLPESPWYYVRAGNDAKAIKALGRIYYGVPGFDASHELAAIKYEVDRQKAATSIVSSYTDLFKGVNLKRTIASCLAIDMQIWAGTPIIFSYTTYFFQQAGIGEAFTSTIIVYVILIGGLLASFVTVETFGRRWLILGGGLVCCLADFVVASLGFGTLNTQKSNTALAFICIWVFSYSSSFAGLSWAMASEIATPRLRSKTGSLAVTTYTAWSLIWTWVVPYMLASTGPGARDWGLKSLYAFGIQAGVGFVLNWIYCPETKGRTYAELDEMYEMRVPPRRMRKYVTTIEESGAKHH